MNPLRQYNDWIWHVWVSRWQGVDLWSLISIHVEDTPLAVSLRVFPEKFYWERKSYPDMDGTIPWTEVPDMDGAIPWTRVSDWILEGRKRKSVFISLSLLPDFRHSTISCFTPPLCTFPAMRAYGLLTLGDKIKSPLPRLLWSCILSQ